METQTKLMDMISDHITAPPDRTRDRIISASKRRFLEQGFSRVTIEELCHDLRISKKTFYKHFKNKEDLVYAVVASNFKLFIPIVQGIFGSDEPAQKKIEQYHDFLFNHLVKNISTAFVADVQAVLPDLWEQIDMFRKTMISNMANVLKRGQAEGILRKDFDPEAATKILLLIVSEVMNPKVLYENRIRLDEAVQTIFTIMTRGIYASPLHEEGA